MQALGNDFVVIDSRTLLSTPHGLALAKSWEQAAPALASSLCDRHYGVGGDGLIIVFDTATMHSHGKLFADFLAESSCDIGWIYVNGDGSPSMMCGNGLRCLALFSVANHFVKTEQSRAFSVATGAGRVVVNYKNPSEIAVNIGQPRLDPVQIPVAGVPDGHVVARKFTVDIEGTKHELSATCVSMGNPHCIIFGDYAETIFADAQLTKIAEAVQQSKYFPEGVNVEFVTVLDRQHLKVLVWERGCGPTLACASGAAASLVAAVLEDRSDRICNISLPGGDLSASWPEPSAGVTLTGSANEVFDGEIDLLKFQSLRGLLAAEAICSQ